MLQINRRMLEKKIVLKFSSLIYFILKTRIRIIILALSIIGKDESNSVKGIPNGIYRPEQTTIIVCCIIETA